MRVSSSHRGNILRLENYKVFAMEHWSNRGHLLSACQWFIENTMHLSFKDIKFVHNFLYLIILHFKVVQKLLHSIRE